MRITTKDGFILINDSGNGQRWEIYKANGEYLGDNVGSEKKVRSDLIKHYDD